MPTGNRSLVGDMSSERSVPATETLDARSIDDEPFGAIMGALEDLDENESLLLINSFEPEPLYSVLADRGFIYETTQVETDEWHVKIEPA